MSVLPRRDWLHVSDPLKYAQSMSLKFSLLNGPAESEALKLVSDPGGLVACGADAAN